MSIVVDLEVRDEANAPTVEVKEYESLRGTSVTVDFIGEEPNDNTTMSYILTKVQYKQFRRNVAEAFGLVERRACGARDARHNWLRPDD